MYFEFRSSFRITEKYSRIRVISKFSPRYFLPHYVHFKRLVTQNIGTPRARVLKFYKFEVITKFSSDSNEYVAE